MAEARLYGLPDTVADDAPGAEYRRAVQAFFDEHQPELVAAEFVVVHRDLNGVGYGGTCDALVRIGGKVYIVDWKSRGEDSQHGAYPEEAAQIAAYARGHYMLVEGDAGAERRELPTIDGGLIVSVKPDGYRVYPVDLDAGWNHWTALHSWWCARRSERDAIGRQWPARKGATPTPVEQKDVLRPTPDEGALSDPASFDALEAAYKALAAEHRAWIGSLVTQAQQAGVSFHAKEQRTARRFDIIAALVRLCRRDDHDEATVRGLLEPIIGECAQYPAVTVGALVGSLSATEAARFALLVRGELAIVVQPDGTPTLQPAA
jgi:hypothetical protein